MIRVIKHNRKIMVCDTSIEVKEGVPYLVENNNPIGSYLYYDSPSQFWLAEFPNHVRYAVIIIIPTRDKQ